MLAAEEAEKYEHLTLDRVTARWVEAMSRRIQRGSEDDLKAKVPAVFSLLGESAPPAHDPSNLPSPGLAPTEDPGIDSLRLPVQAIETSSGGCQGVIARGRARTPARSGSRLRLP